MQAHKVQTESKPTPSEVRAAMGPEMTAWAALMRERFGARLVYLRTPSLTLGRPLPGEEA